MPGPVVTLLEDLRYPTAIAVDAGYVYVADAMAGTVVRADKRGGPVTVLAEDLSCPLDLVLGGEHLYVTLCAEEGAVVRIPKRGGEPEVIAGRELFPAALALDEARVYWTNLGDDRDNGSLRAVPRAGGRVVEIASSQQGPAGIAVDASAVYWLDAIDRVLMREKSGAGQVILLHQPHESVEERLVCGEPARALPIVDGIIQFALVPTPPHLRRIALEDEQIYWQTVSGSIATVGSWDEDRPASTPCLIEVEDAPSAVALGRRWVYWTDWRGNRIRKVRRSCGRPRTVAVRQHRPLAMALDREVVYWTVSGSGPDYDGGAVRARKRR